MGSVEGIPGTLGSTGRHCDDAIPDVDERVVRRRGDRRASRPEATLAAPGRCACGDDAGVGVNSPGHIAATDAAPREMFAPRRPHDMDESGHERDWAPRPGYDAQDRERSQHRKQHPVLDAEENPRDSTSSRAR